MSSLKSQGLPIGRH